MISLQGKTILLTQGQLITYAGSEIVTLELAEYFVRREAKVIIVTWSYGYPIKKEFESLAGIDIYDVDSSELEARIANEGVDIAWIHHSLVPKQLLMSASIKTKFIFHHMSPYYPLEFPTLWQLEESIASKILFNSNETKDAVLKHVPNLNQNLLEVFNNPAPSIFNADRAINVNGALKNVLVVSNHAPREVLEAIEIVRSKGVNVKVFGFGGDDFQRVTPIDIQQADVVLSIGKTVQYSLVGGVPVYCYDHFGGPGYLLNGNFKKADKLNFSGRGFSKKTGDDIAIELMDGYRDAAVYMTKMATTERQKYQLDYRVDRILSELHKDTDDKTIRGDLAISGIKYAEMLNLQVKEMMSLRGELANHVAKYQQLEESYVTQNTELSAIRESRAWGFIIKYRSIKNKFRRRNRLNKR